MKKNSDNQEESIIGFSKYWFYRSFYKQRLKNILFFWSVIKKFKDFFLSFWAEVKFLEYFPLFKTIKIFINEKVFFRSLYRYSLLNCYRLEKFELLCIASLYSSIVFKITALPIRSEQTLCLHSKIYWSIFVNEIWFDYFVIIFPINKYSQVLKSLWQAPLARCSS